MTIIDPFSYSARWSSIGLNCSHCNHSQSPNTWPDLKRVFRCNLHQISLSIVLDESGYIRGEWFCKDFDDKDAFPKAVEEVLTIKGELKQYILYRGYGGKTGRLLEIKFEDIPDST